LALHDACINACGLMQTGIQDLLINPNPSDPAQREAIDIFLRDKAEYSRRVKLQAMKNVPDV
jgi:ubiquitin-conjugating enzyme E2 I